MMIVAVAPAVVFLYLPFFRRLNVTSAYEYLEKRFNTPTRLLGSGSFVLFQLGRMGIVLYLPAAALSTVTGMNVYACIGIMGLLATMYTVLGGIEAVIWTDVVQVVVLLGGAAVSLAIIVSSVDGGLSAIVADGFAQGKFRLANLNWDVTTAALWVVVLGKPMESLISYTSDQTVVQRYLTTSDEKAAARGIWTNAVLTVPASILFFGLGTALWAYYRASPELLNPTSRIDDIFPWFIAQQLPAGVAGLVIAGLFAAAMSSLDSSMNSMATALVTDFYGRFRPAASDRASLRLARWLTVVLGCVGTGLAIYMAALRSTSMWDQYSKVIGLFGGGLAGLFAVGIFTRRATGLGAVLGFVGSAALLGVVKSFTAVHFFLYPAIGVGACFAIAYTIGLVTPATGRDLEGLTVFSLNALRKSE
jgi:SSS family transporter